MKLFEYDVHIGEHRVLCQTRDLRDGAITTPKIADEAVTAEKLAPGSVGHEQLAPEAVADLSRLEAELDAAESVRAQAEELRLNSEADRVSAEQARELAESGRAVAEEHRTNSEAGRELAENAREDRETVRRQRESSRQIAETSRSNAESGRAAAERLRVQAETSRNNQYVSDHQTAVADHTLAGTDHQTAAADHTLAGTDHQTAAADHTRAENDHTLAGTDHQTAAADHTLAGTDHQTAAADHTLAGTDHQTAAADHTRAENDHTASVEATAGASNVNATVNGLVVTITDRTGVTRSVNIGFEILNTYSSVAAMNADAANVQEGVFVMIATTDPTSAENARLYVRNSNAPTSSSPFSFLSDLDQAATSAFADWLENYKPTIEGDHTRAENDHTLAGTDHETAAADHTQAGTDHQTATSDHTLAGTDHETAASDHTLAGTDHQTAVADHTLAGTDHQTAASDHTLAGTDHQTAVADHTLAGTDHQTAVADHTLAGTDHETAASDHTRAENDHTLAGTDHETAASDHTRAENDHTLAGTDHQTAAADHIRAENDHTLAGTDHQTAAADHTLAGTDHQTAAADHTRAENDHTASSNATVAANAAAELAANKATEAGRVNATLNGSVVTITDKNGNSNSIDLLNATEERVQITVTKAQDAPQGATVSGLVINAYYNDASVPTATVTTDANGMAVLRVPNGYKYRLVFPSQTGCETPWDVVHTAAVSQRSVEVEYMAASPTPLTEEVTVVLKNTAGVAQSGKTVTCSVGGSETQQVTDSSGEVTFEVALGSIYTITAPQIEGFYVRGGDYSVSHTADRGERTIVYIYRIFVSGVFIVTGGGDEYTLEQFQQGVEQQQLQKSDALLIKVATQALQDAGGVFCFKIADIAVNSFPRKQWATNAGYTFKSIPSNGNNVKQPYYYDGKTASALIQEEGDQQGIETPAVDWAMAQTVEVDGVTYNGFLMSIGQWNVAWGARDVIDDIIYYLDQTWRKLSQITDAKWSSTQTWYWATSVYPGGKTTDIGVIPAFAL